MPESKTDTKSKIIVTVPIEFTHEQVRDLLCCGLESGHVGSFEIQGYYEKQMDEGSKKLKIEWKKISSEDAHKRWEFPHLDAPFDGCAIAMKDKYGDSDTIYLLHLRSMAKGLITMAEKAPYQFSQFLGDNADAITGDCFVQCALLGSVVYA